MKRLLIALFIIIAATNLSAQRDWPRKYATTVIRGHVTNMPADRKYVLEVWGGRLTLSRSHGLTTRWTRLAISA